MKLRWHLILFLILFAFEANLIVSKSGNQAPAVGDSLEVHNIGYSLAHGRGYGFDWSDGGWRRLLQSQNRSSFEFVLARHGRYPTMFRPPLMPVLVAGVIRLFPENSFVAWRVVDCFGFCVAACLLCEVAYVRGSFVGLIAMLSMLICDPLRRQFVPGWWTEGLAFDLLCWIVWLLASPRRLRPDIYHVLAGVAIGLLCLDRSIFVLIMLPLGVLLAVAGSGSARLRLRGALVILAISATVQIPWWIRNVAISGRFLPLGTQGGMNLPDEYGEIAFNSPIWTGRGMGDAWISPTVRDSNIPLPPGFTERSFNNLWPGNRRMAAMIAAALSTSLQSEIAVSDRGTQTARRWIRANYSRVPALMLQKAEDLTFFFHKSLIATGILTLTGFILLPRDRRLLLYLLAFAAMYVGSVAVTHVIWWRFLVPLLPAIYIVNSLGLSATIRHLRIFMLSRFFPRYQQRSQPAA